MLGFLLAVALTSTAFAGSKEVRYGPAPPWTTPPPAPSTTPSPEGAPARWIYFDMQARAIEGGSESFTAYRVKILSPEASGLGKVTGAWSPSTDDFVVHNLKIIRSGQVIDVLKVAKFQVIQRENNLEQSMLDGVLTATLEVPDLQIGDELEFAGSVRRQQQGFACGPDARARPSAAADRPEDHSRGQLVGRRRLLQAPA